MKPQYYRKATNHIHKPHCTIISPPHPLCVCSPRGIHSMKRFIYTSYPTQKKASSFNSYQLSLFPTDLRLLTHIHQPPLPPSSHSQKTNVSNTNENYSCVNNTGVADVSFVLQNFPNITSKSSKFEIFQIVQTHTHIHA